MRGPDVMQQSLFTCAKLEDFVPADHPLQAIQRMINEALKGLNGLFNEIYADGGRSSIAPEKLIRALLLQVLYSIRSERMLVEQLHYNLLFRWFVGLSIDDMVWDHSSFSKNRDRLLDHAVVEALFAEVMSFAERQGLLSDEHFSVDGTLIKAWASHKSFKPKDEPPADEPPAGRNAESDWKGQARSNDTQESSTDPQARLYKKSEQAESILCYQGHALIENRNGLVVNAKASLADGMAERETALAMLSELAPGGNRTVGTDKAYDTSDFVAAARALGVTPHVAQNLKRRGGSAIDARTTRHAGYELSQCIRKRVEEPFGWGKTVGRIRQTVFRGLRRVDLQFRLTMLANNLVRMRGLLAGVAW
jgi:transposase